MMPRLIAVLAALALAPAGIRAGDVDFDFQLELAAGVDSNPLRMAADERSGAAARLNVAAKTNVELARRSLFFAEVEATTWRFSGDVSNGDRLEGELGVGVAVTPYEQGPRRLTVAFGGRYLMRRMTHTDHLTGDVFTVGSPPTPIPDRFDWNALGAFVDLRWRHNERTTVFLETEVLDRDYVEDYEEIASLQPRDYRRTWFRPGVTFGVRKGVALILSLPWTQRIYDERDARDAAGDSVPGTRRQYDSLGLHVSLALNLRPTWDLSVAWRGAARDDPHAGYYDYTSQSFVAKARRDIGRKSRLLLHASLLDLDYDRATVSNEVDGEIRAREVRLLKVWFVRTMTPRLELFAEGATMTRDSQNPKQSFDRSWGLVGFRYAL